MSDTIYSKAGIITGFVLDYARQQNQGRSLLQSKTNPVKIEALD